MRAKENPQALARHSGVLTTLQLRLLRKNSSSMLARGLGCAIFVWLACRSLMRNTISHTQGIAHCCIDKREDLSASNWVGSQSRNAWGYAAIK